MLGCFLEITGKKNNFTIKTRRVCKLLWPKMCWCDHSVAAEIKELRFLFLQARHAAQIGASGIAVISPSFYKPSAAGRNHEEAHLSRNILPTGSQGCHTAVVSTYQTFSTLLYFSVSRHVEDVPQGSSCGCSDSALLLLSPPCRYWRQRLASLNFASILQPSYLWR